MLECTLARSKIRDLVAVTRQDVLVRQKSLKSYRASRVELARAYADFRTESESESVGKSRRAVNEAAD